MESRQFADRVEKMQASLYRVAYGILLNQADCADAVQEALLKAWMKRNTLRDETLFGTWLTRILINECCGMLRRRRPAVPLDALRDIAAPPDADPVLHDAIARLDKKLRIAVVLHYMEGYSVTETASLLRVPSGTIKTRLARARALLRNELIDTERSDD